MKRKQVVLGVLVAYVLLLFLGAVLRVPAAVSGFGHYDKVVHFVEFFILAFLLFFVLRSYGVSLWFGVLVGACCVALSEVAQLFVASRTFSYADIIADVAGFLTGVGVFFWMSSKRLF